MQVLKRQILRGAVEELPELTPNAGVEAVVAEEIVVDDSDIEALEEDEETDEEISEEPFYEVQVVDGIAVSVSADPGVFPEGASLFVRAVDPSEIAPAEESIEEERDDNVKVASSYTFDIKVFDAEGNEIQPDTSKGKVCVSFAMAEADNANLSADIYHIDDELNVDKLDTETVTDSDNPVVVAETEGFSYYQVEFTYGEMQYVLPGDSEVPLQEILDYLGISGNVTNAYGSNDSLFSAENRDGEWYVIAHQAFKSNEWLKVTLDGVEMDVEIVVTDASGDGKSYTIAGGGITLDDGTTVPYPLLLNTDDELSFSLGPMGDLYRYALYLDNSSTHKHYFENNQQNQRINDLFGKKVVLNFINTDQSLKEVNLYFLTSLTVTLDRNGGTGGSDPSWATKGDYLPTIQVPTQSGYSFLGYYDDATAGTQYYKADGTCAKVWDKDVDTTLYAHWTANTYEVTFDKRSGSGGSNSVTATYDSDMPEATMPTRTGYTFAGYWDAASGGTQYYKADGSSARTWNKALNTTLYAHWTGNKYTVTLNSQNGTGGSTSVEATYGSAMPSMTKPTRTGYTFGGYYTETNGGGTQYYNENGASVRNWDKTADTILYAKWTINTYEVKFNGNGSTSGTMTNQSFTYGTAQNLTANAFVRQYTVTYNYNGATGGASSASADAVAAFNGWATSETGNKEYDDQQSVNNLTTTNGGTVNLYAKWTNGSVTLPTPTKTGYTFGGWYSDSDLNTQVGNGGGSYTPTEPLNLYAKWTANKYTVTLNQNYDGGGSEEVEATYDSAMPAATMPTREGYVFCGYWDTNAQTGGTQYYNADGTSASTWNKTEDTMLYARWKLQAAVTTAPTAKTLTYTSYDQELVTAGQVNNTSLCKIQYKIGTEGQWLDVIPKGVLAGNYEVYYKATTIDADRCVDSVVYGPVDNVKIAKAPLTVTPDSGITKQFGDVDPTFTYSVTGLLGTDTVAVLSGALSRTPIGTTDDEKVGEYEIVIGTLAADNYNITVRSGVKFKIVKKVPPSTNAAELPADMKPTAKDLPYTAGPLNLVAAPTVSEHSLDGYRVLYSTDGETWSTTIPTGTADGHYKVYVKYEADSNHEDITGILEYEMNITVAATVDGVRYGTIAEAIDVWNNNGGTLVLQENSVITSTANLNENRDRVLDLNGYTLESSNSNDPAINITEGSLTITDSREGGKIDSAGMGIYAGSNSTVNISDGTISSNGDTIQAYGNVNVSGGEIVSLHSDAIRASSTPSGTSTVNITGGKINSETSNGIFIVNNANVSISGGTVSGEGHAVQVNTVNGSVEIIGNANIGETGVYLGGNSKIDVTNGVTSNGPIKVEMANPGSFTTTQNESAYQATTDGYLDMVGDFAVVNNGKELTIANGQAAMIDSNPYGDLAVTAVVLDENGNEKEIQIPLSPANIEFLLPGLAANDVVYTPAEGDKPATFVIKSGDENDSFEIPKGLTLVIPAGMEVTIGKDVTLNNNGNIVNNGLLINDGTIQGNGSITNDGTGGDDGILCNNGKITGNVSITNTNLGGIENEGEISIPEIINNGEDSGIINREKGSITSDITGDGIIINIGIITGDLTILDNGNLDNLGQINGDISSDGEIINTGKITGDVTSSGSVYNTGELTGDVSNLEEGIIYNYNGASISGNVNNEGEFHNKGDISGDIVNSGDFENNATYDEEDESKNKIGTISGNITNNGNFLNEGEISGDIINTDGGEIDNEGEISGDINNDGAFDNNGTLSGNISNSGELINDGNITGDNDISNSGNMINNGTIDTTGIITNHPEGVLENGEDAVITNDIDNHGTFNNDGTASGDIVNSGEVNNTGDISGDIVNQSEGELNNAGTVSGNIDNRGVVNNDEEGVISGAIKNENGANVNNNAGATISGDITNEGGTVKNDSEGTISGSIDNNGYLINKGGKVTGDVTTGKNGVTITVPKDSKSDVSISEDGKITIPAGSTITTVDENGKTNTITIPKDASGSDVTYTFDESDLKQITQAKDGTTEVPAGTIITKDGVETVLEFGGVIDAKGQVTPNADPNAPQSSGDGSGSSDGSNAAGDAANTGKKPGSNTNGKKPANTTETDDKENQNADDKELADEEETDEDEDDAETSEGLTDEITSGSAREDKYGSGNVRIEVESVNEDGSVSTLTGTLHGSTESILKACLTKEELERVKAGESVVVKLVVMPLEDKVPDSDKKEIEASLDSAANAPLAIGKFIDLTVMKKIGDGDWEKVTDLNEELEITIEIDKELQADGRVFYVLRYHDGEVTTLEDQDNNPETITIKTKLFSTYAIAFIADSNAVKHGFPWWILILLLILIIIASAVTGTIIYIKNRK